MRYLNKIIFINSAHIKYAEINLDGNVHFTGTQGVGKSTLLRAILFFYNADTQGLGIPREKERYTEYYFRNANSFIIYEVCRDEGKFCVVSYKSQNKVCFRFFEGAYKQDYFISQTGNVPDNWEAVAAKLDQHRVFYTKRKIEEHKEYRDILYGNHDDKKKEYRRYSLLESKDYQYLPKTIQNVFLNSKMEAEFIKQTIIMSLGNDMRIDLAQHAYNLEGFETQIEDIKRFKLPSTKKLAISIADKYIQIRYFEKEKIRLAGELVKACDANEKQEPVYKHKLDKKSEEKHGVIEKLGKARESFGAKNNKLTGEISIIENELTKARDAKLKYEKMNIDSIIERVNQKERLNKEYANLTDERNLHTSAFAEINLKYAALIEQLVNQNNDFINNRNAEIIKVKENFLLWKDNLYREYSNLIEELRVENKKSIDESRLLLDEKKDAVHHLKIDKERVRNQRYFETDIHEQELIRQSAEKEISRITSENETGKLTIEILERQWANDLQHLERTNNLSIQQLSEKRKKAEAEIKEIDFYLENSKNSLFGWLSENYTDWQNTIGKIIDEKNVLFQNDLNPVFTGKSDTLYGVRLNLDQVNKSVTTMEDYKREKAKVQEYLTQLKQEFDEQTQKFESSKDNLKRKFQPKIAESKKLIRENEYRLQQAGIRLNEVKVRIINLKQSAADEKKRNLEAIENNLETAVNALSNAKEALEKIEQELVRLIAVKNRERDRKLEAEKEKTEKLIEGINLVISQNNINLNLRKEELMALQQNELAQKGADTKRLNEIKMRLNVIETELNFIEDNRDNVAVYRIVKRDQIDRVDEFKRNQEKLTKQLEIEVQKHEKKKAELEGSLKVLETYIMKLSDKLKEIREDKEIYEQFTETECYKSLIFDFTGKVTHMDKEGQTGELFDVNQRVKTIVDLIKEIHHDKLGNTKSELKGEVIELTGKFSVNNVLKFKRQFSDDASYLDFAEMLSDFIEENKIDRIEKEVNERFALIINTIGNETSNMIKEAGEIQKIIRKINDDFRDREIAVGVIKMIELKIDESKNEIFLLLKKISEFNSANGMLLGTRNLFSSEDADKKNKEAVDLLKAFSKKIPESKKEYIVLADSFDLKFRIEENQNTTGWVEKLSNVGSDGTDVLVKAMVNIMLLNVFKEGASRSFKDFKLHCMMDEIGKLHPVNVRGILKFANQRNIMLINGSPIENDALAFKHIYQLKKDNESNTRVKRLMTQLADVKL